jgi:parvulin-like peptidyl-prolyl isomerase
MVFLAGIDRAAKKGDTMPRAKKSKSTRSAKPVKAVHEMIDTKTEYLIPNTPHTVSSGGSRFYKHRWTIFIIILIAVAGAYLGSKGYLVAATVNGQPVFGWDVERAMMSRYGVQTLDAIISERLVAGAAQKAGIEVTQKDVDTKVSELTKSLGPGVKIEDLLAYQGVTRSEFENQVKLQLTIEKLLGKDIKITDSDITAYIASNEATLTATDEAGMRTEAQQALFSQAISQKVQPWFTDLKAKASVVRLLK